MHPYLPKLYIAIYRSRTFLFTEVVHYYLPIMVHCYLPITISYLIYLAIKPDPEIQKKNEEVNKIRTEYISRFNYNPDSLANKIFVMGYFNNGTSLKKKYLVLDEDENGKYSFDASSTRQLPDSLVAFNIIQLQTLILLKYIKGEQHFEDGFEVSADHVEIYFVNLKTSQILKTDYVSGHQIIRQSRRSHIKEAPVYQEDISKSILKNIIKK